MIKVLYDCNAYGIRWRGHCMFSRLHIALSYGDIHILSVHETRDLLSFAITCLAFVFVHIITKSLTDGQYCYLKVPVMLTYGYIKSKCYG